MIDFVSCPIVANPDNVPPVRFVFRDGQNLLVDPAQPDRLLEAPEFASENAASLGWLQGRPCLAVAVAADTPAPPGLEFVGLRSLYGQMDENLRCLAGGGFQLLHWQRTHRFCGACGTPTQPKTDEHAMACPQCGQTAFPRLDPAVIVGVLREGRLLLAHNRRFRGNLHSLIAGFVEVGESLEQTVAREIREEVGIEVDNIRYFGSQSWPFPSTIMLGFVARYAGGELHPDGEEIVTADWFARGDLPDIPGPGSISRRIIDAFEAGELE
jgi:NAD+ diphosphatase